MPNVWPPAGTRLLIAGVSTRAMAESAAKAGYDVTALDAFGDLDQQSGVRALSLPRDFGVSFSAAAAAQASRTIQCDAVAYLSPFENHPSAVARLAQDRSLLGNQSAVLSRARDPNALPIPDGMRSDRWLIKPRASGGGHGVQWWIHGNPVPPGSYVQPFIDGEPCSIVFVAANGAAVPFGLTRQLIGDERFGASGFRYCGSILSRRSERAAGPSALLESATRLARAVTERLGLVGINCVDFIARDGIAVPIEINPRWSASMELAERAFGLSVFALHAAACTTGELPTFALADTRSAQAFGKAIVFARHDVVCGDTRGWLDDPAIRDVPHAGERIPAARPVCTVFANGLDDDSCYAALVQRAGAVYETLDAWSSIVV